MHEVSSLPLFSIIRFQDSKLNQNFILCVLYWRLVIMFFFFKYRAVGMFQSWDCVLPVRNLTVLCLDIAMIQCERDGPMSLWISFLTSNFFFFFKTMVITYQRQVKFRTFQTLFGATSTVFCSIVFFLQHQVILPKMFIMPISVLHQ